MITIIAQILSISAMLLTMLSMQCRSNRNFFLFQESSGILFMISFFMLGAWGGALMNIFGVIRPEVLRHEKIAGSRWTLAGLIILLVLLLLTGIVLFHESWHLAAIVGLAQLAGTVAMWSQNGKAIRYAQLAAVTPLWLLYNFLLPIPSIGGILSELINIVSCVTALYRYRKLGFTKR